MLDNQTNEIEGGISLDKIVIIGRTKFVLDKVAEELSKNNLSYYFKKSERNVENLSRFGKVLNYAINIKLNPKNWIDAQKLFNTLSIEIGKKDEFLLDDFIQKITIENIEQALFKELLSKVNELNPSEPNIPKLVKDMIIYLGSMANDSNNEMSKQDEYLISNSNELESLNRKWTKFKRKGLGNSLSAFKNAISLGKLNDDSNEQGITLSTVHTMKGLEKDIVFLIGMCEGIFPYYLATTPDEIEEEKNNAFVAITRAKRWLFISYPKTRKMPWGDVKTQRKSRFLDNIKDKATKDFVMINYGPWERLNGNEPFIEGFGNKPAGANYYPVDMSKEEFEKLLMYRIEKITGKRSNIFLEEYNLKKKIIKYLVHKEVEIYISGNVGNLKLRGDNETLDLIYKSGILSSRNSEGFGMVEII